MSQLKDILYPGQRRTGFTDIATLEEENFAWIDFFWSLLGRSGEVGTDMGVIYADLTSPADIDGLVSNLTAAMLAKGKGAAWLHPAERWALNAIFKREANHVARSERGTPTVTLTAQGQAELRTYLEGPVRGQVQQEWGHIPEKVSFVYGHTHKPFVDHWTVPGFPAPVRIFNTGGWVVDTALPARSKPESQSLSTTTWMRPRCSSTGRARPARPAPSRSWHHQTASSHRPGIASWHRGSTRRWSPGHRCRRPRRKRSPSATGSRPPPLPSATSAGPTKRSSRPYQCSQVRPSTPRTAAATVPEVSKTGVCPASASRAYRIRQAAWTGVRRASLRGHRRRAIEIFMKPLHQRYSFAT
jgi:hypothetical protein